MESNRADKSGKSEMKESPVPNKADMTTTTYQAYMLRIWQESDDLPWRASLQNPHTGEQKNFATLAHLYTFLDRQTQ